MRESPELALWWTGGSLRSCLRSNLFSLYFADGKLYTEQGQELTDRTVPLAGLLPKIAGEAVARGTYSVERGEDGTAVFRLLLDEDAIAETAYAIAPAAREQALSFTGGTAEIAVRGGTVTEITLRCDGQVRIAGLSLSASFSAVLTPDDALADTFSFGSMAE